MCFSFFCYSVYLTNTNFVSASSVSSEGRKDRNYVAINEGSCFKVLRYSLSFDCLKTSSEVCSWNLR